MSQQSGSQSHLSTYPLSYDCLPLLSGVPSHNKRGHLRSGTWCATFVAAAALSSVCVIRIGCHSLSRWRTCSHSASRRTDIARWGWRSMTRRRRSAGRMVGKRAGDRGWVYVASFIGCGVLVRREVLRIVSFNVIRHATATASIAFSFERRHSMF